MVTNTVQKGKSMLVELGTGEPQPRRIFFDLGTIARKPGIVGEEIKIREYLSMTVLFDHDVTDGFPVVRFIQRLSELLEHSYGLTM